MVRINALVVFIAQQHGAAEREKLVWYFFPQRSFGMVRIINGVCVVTRVNENRK